MAIAVLGFPVDERLRQRLALQAGQSVPPVREGSVQMPCSLCRSAIWIGPRCQEYVQQGGTPLCPWCSLKVGFRQTKVVV